MKSSSGCGMIDLIRSRSNSRYGHSNSRYGSPLGVTSKKMIDDKKILMTKRGVQKKK